MIKRLALTAALSTCAFAQTAAPDLNGTWKIQTSVMGNESLQQCTIIQKDAVLSGSCKRESGEQKLSGKIAGDTITWSIDGEYEGTALTTTYTGKLNGSEVKGTVDVTPFSVDGEFVATRSK